MIEIYTSSKMADFCHEIQAVALKNIQIFVVHTEFKWVAKNDPALSELTSPLCAL